MFKQHIFKLTQSCLLALIAMAHSMAQSTEKENSSSQFAHEFSIYGGGGIAMLQATPKVATGKIGAGGMAGIGYDYFFMPHWSIGTGIGFAMYTASMRADSIKGGYTTSSVRNEQFDFRYAYANYQEKASITMLTIPIMVRYQTLGKVAFYAGLGGKVTIPIVANTTTKGKLTTSGYFSDIHVNYQEIPSLNFSNYEVSEKQTPKMQVAFSLSAEAGIKCKLGEKGCFYAGVYCDYGLTSIGKGGNGSLVGYKATPPLQLTYSSLYGSSSQKLTAMNIGIVVRFALGIHPLENQNNNN